MQTPSATSHADKVAGWIVIALFASGVSGMLLAALRSGLSTTSQAQLLSIASASVGALAGSLTVRLKVQAVDNTTQVTVPSLDPETPQLTVQNTTSSAEEGQPAPQAVPAAQAAPQAKPIPAQRPLSLPFSV